MLRVLRKLGLRWLESRKNVEQDQTGQNNRRAVGVQKQNPRLAQGNNTKYHQPHRKQLQLMGVTSHRWCPLLSYGSKGDSAQQMIAKQESEDRHRQQEKDGSGCDR